MKKYLFIGEFNASYTGGSLVWISTEDNIEKVIGKDFLPVTDEESINRFNFARITIEGAESNEYGAVSQTEFEAKVRQRFSGDFLEKILAQLKKKGYKYPGYYNQRRVRKDWFKNIKPKEGIYIVLKIAVDDFEKERVVSDTYYCG